MFDKSVEWYVLKGANKVGPYDFLGIIRMLQDRSLYEFDFVWNKNMESWERVAERPEFSSDSLRLLLASDSPEILNVFFRRRHPRVDFSTRVIIHDNRKIWNSKCIEVSMGGAGIKIPSSILAPGDVIFLHFNESNELPAFNAVGHIVSRQFVPGTEKRSSVPVKYGIKFTKVDAKIEAILKDFAANRFQQMAA